MSDTKQGQPSQVSMDTLTQAAHSRNMSLEAFLMARMAHDVLGITPSSDEQKKGLLGRMKTAEDTISRIERGHRWIVGSAVTVMLTCIFFVTLELLDRTGTQ